MTLRPGTDAPTARPFGPGHGTSACRASVALVPVLTVPAVYGIDWEGSLWDG
ncbi:MAG: hypothetical protein WAS95_12810 [Nostocoides sp.]